MGMIMPHIWFLLSRVFIGLMIGSRDGRIKIIGGDNIEGLLISPKKLPLKNLEVCMSETFVVQVFSHLAVPFDTFHSLYMKVYCIHA